MSVGLGSCLEPHKKCIQMNASADVVRDLAQRHTYFTIAMLCSTASEYVFANAQIIRRPVVLEHVHPTFHSFGLLKDITMASLTADNMA